MMRKRRVHVFISGRVQGVFFRASAKKKARGLGITGWIKNLPGGRVEAVLEGDSESVEKIVDWAKKGPPAAKVQDIEVEEKEYRAQFDSFKIVR